MLPVEAAATVRTKVSQGERGASEVPATWCAGEAGRVHDAVGERKGVPRRTAVVFDAGELFPIVRLRVTACGTTPMLQVTPLLLERDALNAVSAAVRIREQHFSIAVSVGRVP